MTLLVDLYWNCVNGHRFLAPVLVENYSPQLARTTRPGSEHLGPPIPDPVYAQVRALLVEVAPPHLDPAQDGELLQRAASVWMDAAADGLPLTMNAGPACPECGARQYTDYGEEPTAKAYERDLPEVTHRGWDALSPDERRARLEDFVRTDPYASR